MNSTDMMYIIYKEISKSNGKRNKLRRNSEKDERKEEVRNKFNYFAKENTELINK